MDVLSKHRGLGPDDVEDMTVERAQTLVDKSLRDEDTRLRWEAGLKGIELPPTVWSEEIPEGMSAEDAQQGFTASHVAKQQHEAVRQRIRREG